MSWKEKTVETQKGPSLRVKKGAVSGMLFPERVSKKKFGHSMGSSSGACSGRDGE